MARARTGPAQVAELHGSPDRLDMTLLTAEAVVAIQIPLTAASAHALGHIYALHAHHHRCQASPDVQVGLLLESIEALGGRADCVVVRGGQRPAFWLRLRRGEETSEVDLGVLDAVCLLAGRRVPVEVETD